VAVLAALVMVDRLRPVPDWLRRGIAEPAALAGVPVRQVRAILPLPAARVGAT
jgi:hypothetical protein